MTRMSSFSRMGAVSVVLALASPVVVAAPAQAEAATSSISCAFEDHIATSPPLHPTNPQPYTFKSVERGWIECTGTLDGHVLSGRGWFTQIGTTPESGGSVAYAAGGADLVGAHPVLGGGELELEGHFWLTRVGATGGGTGHINGEFAWTKYVATPCTPAAPTACTGPRGTTATVRGIGGTFSDGQVIAPSAPTGIGVTVDGSGVNVSWEPGSDGGTLPVTGYRIYREHVLVGEVGADATTFTEPSPGVGTHNYSVVAFVNIVPEEDMLPEDYVPTNAVSVESDRSERVTVTIEESTPWQAEPSDPFNAPWHLKAETSGEGMSDVELTWKRPRLKDVESYEVYSSRDDFSPIARVDGTDHVDPSVDFQCGRSYTYYVAAVAADGTKTWSDPLAVGPFTEIDQGC